MQIWLGFILGLIFLSINILIILRDIRERIIPNKYLLHLIYLFPIYLLYIFYFSIIPFNAVFFIGNILFILCICFLLFYINMWGAGDAKYLIILSLFIPNINILIFIGNIAIATFCYLGGSYIYFYLSQTTKKTGLIPNVIKDIKHKMQNFTHNATLQKLLLYFLIFIMFFISMRIYRIYIIEFILQSTFSPYVFIIGIILISIGAGFLYFMYKKYCKNYPFLRSIMLLSFSTIFIIFIGYEYYKDNEKFIHILYKILTLYLGIFVVIKILKYSLYIYSGQDYYLKSIANLDENDIIERKDFNRKILPLIQNNKSILRYYNIPLYGNINVNTYMKEKLIAMVRSINKNNKKAFGGNSIIKDFKCMKTFAFAPYLFSGFMLSFIFQERIVTYISEQIYALFL